jgi:hypothetical protein
MCLTDVADELLEAITVHVASPYDPKSLCHFVQTCVAFRRTASPWRAPLAIQVYTLRELVKYVTRTNFFSIGDERTVRTWPGIVRIIVEHVRRALPAHIPATCDEAQMVRDACDLFYDAVTRGVDGLHVHDLRVTDGWYDRPVLDVCLHLGSQLRHLSLCRNNLGEGFAAAFASTLRLRQGWAMSTLDLSDNNLGPAAAARLFPSLGRLASLQHLKLQCNGLRDEGVGLLFEAARTVPGYLGRLRTLRVFENDTTTGTFPLQTPELPILVDLMRTLKGDGLSSLVEFTANLSAESPTTCILRCSTLHLLPGLLPVPVLAAAA